MVVITEDDYEDEKWYMERIFRIAQDRRYTTAIDVWAIILDAVFTKRSYVNIDGREIIGITATDIAIRLNMHLSSVYHNLKILQSKGLNLLETEDLIGYNEKGRRITQKVFRVPEIYYTEYRSIYDRLQQSGFKAPHKDFTFFNLLKIKGVLSHYAALLHKDRMLVDENLHEVPKWYEDWYDDIRLSQFNVTPGVIYRFTKKDMKKILTEISELIDKHKDNYSEEHEARDETPYLLTYLVFAPYTDSMKSNEWMNREEYMELLAKVSDAELDEEVVQECQKDHDTFFKYGLSCPVCGKKSR